MKFQARKVVLFSIALLLLSMLASYVAVESLNRKIAETVHATQRISQGDLGVLISSVSQDEIGVLARSVNDMAMRIRCLLDFEIEAARQEKELKTAQTVQQTLFSPPCPGAGFISVYGHFEPASECAGDWWMDFPLSPTRHLIAIADATGHGASAALIVAMAYSFFQTKLQILQPDSQTIHGPATLLNELSTLLFNSGKGRTTMTLFLSYIDTESMTLTYANAGHIAPLLLPKSENDHRLNKKTTNPAKSRMNPVIGGGPMLGYQRESTFEDKCISLAKGDRLILYTDGFTECLDEEGKALSPMDLRRQIALQADLHSETLCKSLISLAERRLGKAQRQDDITVVVAEILDQNEYSLPISQHSEAV